MSTKYTYKIPGPFTPGVPKMSMEWTIELVGLEALHDAIVGLTSNMKKIADQSTEAMLDKWLEYMHIATRTWSEAPEFGVDRVRFAWSGGVTEFDIDITDKPFMWVDQGTRGPYPIPKSGSGRLRFQTGYTAKTVMGSAIGALPGGPSGPFIVRRHVTHPGLKPRNMSGKVSDIVEKESMSIVEKVADSYLGGWWTPGIGIAR